MRLIRLAYDNKAMAAAVKAAVELLHEVGRFSRRKIVTYVLYNFRDDPEDLFHRIRDLLSWGVAAYPMRYQPLDALEKDKHVSPGWTEEQLEAVMKARRVIGFGGAFPPYEGLVQKFERAKSADEAFALWEPRQRSVRFPKRTRSAKSRILAFTKSGAVSPNIGRLHSRNGSVGEVAIHRFRSRQAGRYACFVTRKGLVKRTSLLAIRECDPHQIILSIPRGDGLIAVVEADKKDAICALTKHGRLPCFRLSSVGPKSLAHEFSKRLELEHGDHVLLARAFGEGQRLLLVTSSGISLLVPPHKLFYLRGRGLGNKAIEVNRSTGKIKGLLVLSDDAERVLFHTGGRKFSLALGELEQIADPATGRLVLSLRKGERIREVRIR